MSYKYFMLSIFCAVTLLPAQERALDSFDSLAGWTAFASDGVVSHISSDSGLRGQCMRIDLEYLGGAGYGGAFKKMPMSLPPNYAFSFYVKASIPVNNFEIKLSDTTGDNVWWVNKRNFTFPREWKKITIKKRHLLFAWGPNPSPAIPFLGKFEFTVTTGTGGKGTVWIDSLTVEPLADDTSAPPPIIADASVNRAGAHFAVDGDSSTGWRVIPKVNNARLNLILGRNREFGGMILTWGTKGFASDYLVLASNDARVFDTLAHVTRGNGGRDYLYLPESEARYIQIEMTKFIGEDIILNEVALEPLAFSSSKNAFYERIAHDSPRGYYPKYFTPQASYWTVFGAARDEKEGLINEEGMFETDKGCFSVEPFLFADGKFITWNDASCTQSLEKKYLPIPSVHWKTDALELTTTVFAAGESGHSTIVASYRLRNTSRSHSRGNLFLALRPFQTNPTYQWLNTTGGVAPVRTIDYDGADIHVNATQTVVPLQRPDQFGCAAFEEGDISSFLSRDVLPEHRAVDDPFSCASGALRYAYDLRPDEVKEISLVIPFHAKDSSLHANLSPAEAAAYVRQAQEATARSWEQKVNGFDITLPPEGERIINTMRSMIAYILINRDGPAIQPGSRSYERAWIRDGSLTSSALLRLGDTTDVRAYLDWYSRFQYPDGKIPCVVDSRGADPVPENDSHGEFIFAVLQHFYFTHDTTFLRSKYANVTAAVRYIETLRAKRMTDYYKNGNDSLRSLFGLMPESISHEGYSAKPMHSYWDDFFTLTGLKDAAEIALILGDRERAAAYAALRDDFRATLYASIRLACANRRIPYIPGCAELGDFDATSTAISLYPAGELSHLPRPALDSTFEKYFEFFRQRASTGKYFDYTPYELRVCGSMVYLGKKERAHEMLAWFLRGQRPAAWNAWAEVVYADSTLPRFIGDMPHTWVGSEFLNAVRAMFAYEDEDSVLVVGAGLKDAWLRSPQGVQVKDLPTYYGLLSYTIRFRHNQLDMTIRLKGKIPHGGVRVPALLPNPMRSLSVNGKKIPIPRNTVLMLTRLPADVHLHY
jgi:hypothetical protein